MVDISVVCSTVGLLVAGVVSAVGRFVFIVGRRVGGGFVDGKSPGRI